MSDDNRSKYAEVWVQTLPTIVALLLIGVSLLYVEYWGVTEAAAWSSGALAMHIGIRYPTSLRR